MHVNFLKEGDAVTFPTGQSYHRHYGAPLPPPLRCATTTATTVRHYHRHYGVPLPPPLRCATTTATTVRHYRRHYGAPLPPPLRCATTNATTVRHYHRHYGAPLPPPLRCATTTASTVRHYRRRDGSPWSTRDTREISQSISGTDDLVENQGYFELYRNIKTYILILHADFVQNIGLISVIKYSDWSIFTVDITVAGRGRLFRGRSAKKNI